MSKSTLGTELMRQIAEGRIEHLPSEYLAKTRDEISAALEELIEVGARIRPLLVGDRQIGWVRGIHLSERKILKRWIYNEHEFISKLMQIGTTLTAEEIDDLSMVEVRSLSRLVREMTASDMRLYPYLQPFTTTSISEQLWYSKGIESTSFRNRYVELPDGKRMKIIAASDQARLWATLCNYRIQTKERLDASFNAVLTIRPWVGKGADPLATDLKRIARSLQTDSFEPWREVIRAKSDVRFDDGWAHSEDDSIEGMQREMNGILSNDRHEQVVAFFEARIREKAEAQKRRVEERLLKRQRELEQSPRMVVRTESEVRAQTEAFRRQREQIKPVEEESQSSVADRLAKYK